MAEGIEKTDSIEDRKYFMVKSVPEKPIVMKILDFESILGGVEKLALVIQETVSGEEEASTNSTRPYLEDRDLSNVFELVSHLFKIRKIFTLRVAGKSDSSVAILAAKTLASLVSVCNVDLAVGGSLVQECLDVLFCLTLSVVARKNSDRTAFLNPENIAEFTNAVVKKLVKESIEIVDNHHIVSDEEDEEISAVTVACLQLVLLMYLVSSGSTDRSASAACGLSTIVALSSLSESNVTVSTACWIAETMFVVFGESDNDEILKSTPDWISRMSSLILFLNSKSVSYPERAAYIQGTVENIQAFLHYKQ